MNKVDETSAALEEEREKNADVHIELQHIKTRLLVCASSRDMFAARRPV